MTHPDGRDVVLIVEDDVESAKALAEFLSLESFDSIIVENGREAMAMLRTGRRPCLILLDIMMPVAAYRSSANPSTRADSSPRSGASVDRLMERGAKGAG